MFEGKTFWEVIMKVLHYGFGGQMIVMCEALKKIGIDATSCHMMQTPQNFKADIYFEQKDYSKEQLHQRLLDMSKQYDVFHFHFGRTFMFDRSDLPYLKKLGKKMIVQHRGSDVRRLSIARTFNNPYVTIKKQFFNEEKRISILKNLSSSIDHAIVADHELLPYITNFYKNIHLVPQAIHVNNFNPLYPAVTNEVPLIIHSPTHYKVKGTKYVLAAVNQLRKEGYRFTFQLMSDLPHDQAIKLYRKADIIIDQLMIGSFGIFSLEAMALGKPVICFIRNDLIEKYPKDLPIVNANPKTIYSKLKSLLTNPKQRYQLGVQGRQFVETYHDSLMIAEKLKGLYQEI